MSCELELNDPAIQGKTFYPKAGSTCLKPSGVYVPQVHNDKDTALNVVLYLHGHFVHSPDQLFNGDRARVRQQVLDSGKDVVLIAPHLGYRHCVDDACSSRTGPFSLDTLGKGKGGEQYLDEVLDALKPHLGLTKRPDIKNLVLASHSGGGALMLTLVDTLGKYEPKLKECWGFDCLYDEGSSVSWFQWVQKTGHPLFIVYGTDTVFESVQLFLMAQGILDRDGNKLASVGPKAANITVIPAFYKAYPMYGKMVDVKLDMGAVNDELKLSTIRGTKVFVSKAVENFKDNYPWPTSGINLHYLTTTLLTSQLKATNFP